MQASLTNQMDKYLERAIEAVKSACLLCEEIRQEMVSVGKLEKQDRSPVTIADFGSQALVSLLLQRAFPDIPIVAEEDSALLRRENNRPILDALLRVVRNFLSDLSPEQLLGAIDSGGHAARTDGFFWTIDPIDGTKGFLRGDQYAVALGLVTEGEVQLGVLGCPGYPGKRGQTRGYLFAAAKGRGAYRIGLRDGSTERIRVSDVRSPVSAQFCESFESAHSSHEHSARIAEVLGMERPPLRMDSQSKYAAVAQGDAEIYLRLPTKVGYQEKIWDHAAGWILVKEAGGEVTDVRGAPLDFSAGRTLARNVGVVATNGYLHEQVLRAVSTVLA